MTKVLYACSNHFLTSIGSTGLSPLVPNLNVLLTRDEICSILASGKVRDLKGLAKNLNVVVKGNPRKSTIAQGIFEKGVGNGGLVPEKVEPKPSITSIKGAPKAKSVETKEQKVEEAVTRSLQLSTQNSMEIVKMKDVQNQHDDRLVKLEKVENGTKTSSGTSSWHVPAKLLVFGLLCFCFGIGGSHWYFESRSSSSMANHGAHYQNVGVRVEVEEGVEIQVGPVKISTSRGEHVQSGASSSSSGLSLTTSGGEAPAVVSDDGITDFFQEQGQVSQTLANAYVKKKTFFKKVGCSEKDAAVMAYRDVNVEAIAGAHMNLVNNNHAESMDHASDVAKDMMDTARDIHKESEAAEDARHEAVMNVFHTMSRERKIIILVLLAVLVILPMVGRMVFSVKFLRIGLILFVVAAVLMALLACILYWYGSEVIALIEKYFSLGPWVLRVLAIFKTFFR